MSFAAITCIRFLLSSIGFAICYIAVFKSLAFGIPISLFLSACIFFDPKRYAKSKQKYEEKLKTNSKKHN